MSEIIILPIEVNELVVKVSANKQAEVQTVLQQIFTGTDDWEKQVDAIEVKDINDKMSIELADVARKNSKQARLSAEKIFDAKREEVQNLKAEFDLEDKLWLKAKQVMQLKFKSIEVKAEWKANYAKRYEVEQFELRTQKRINEVQKYAEINRFEFDQMSDESFVVFANGLKTTYDAKIEAERKAEAEREAERIEAERIEKERIEKQRLENERLNAEADKREKEIEAERKLNDQILAEAIAKAKVEKDRIEAENKKILDAETAKLLAETEAKIKIQKELQAKKEAEIKAENERKELEIKAKKEAEKLAKAPIKKQLSIWVDGFSIPEINIENQKKTLIKEKFEAFKRWAKTEIENI